MDIWRILEYTASVTVIGLLIWLIKLIFHDKLDARWHYFIWLVLLVRVLVPARVLPIPTPLSVFREIPLGRWAQMGRILAQEKGYGEFAHVLGQAYLWGAGLLGAFYLVLWAVLRLQVALAPRADEAVREYVDGIAAKYGLPGCRDIRIRKSGTPYICGLVHPVLVLPDTGALSGRASRERRKDGDFRQGVRDFCQEDAGFRQEVRGFRQEDVDLCQSGRDFRQEDGDFGRCGTDASTAGEALPKEQVILHELLHKRYRDVLVNLAVHVVRVVNWFNPFVWFLTAAILNDSEALCDQRVLEHCGAETARGYGELLIGMGERQRRPSVRIGTSNMAGAYRNMKIRIRRIRDFKRVPRKIGMVTLCITLMLTVSAIGSTAEEAYDFDISEIDSEKDLERALLYARCYHAHTPQEAVCLFLRACEKNSPIDRMAVMPEKEIPQYREFVGRWFGSQEAFTWAELSAGEEETYPAYFPAETGRMLNYRVYNLVYDRETGKATVCVTPHRQRGQIRLEWELELTYEDGWKVWLSEETRTEEGEYIPEPLFGGSAELGNFHIELSAYNEGVFRQFETAGTGLFLHQNSAAVEEGCPEYFSMEYKCKRVTMSYLGEDSLEGRMIKVVVNELWDGDAGRNQEDIAGEQKIAWCNPEDNKEVDPAGYREELAAMAGEGGEEPDAATVESYGQYDSDGNGMALFDGGELTGGVPRLICGGGNGYSQPGYCWKEGDRIGVYVQVYIDGELAEEGEVWSGNL